MSGLNKVMLIGQLGKDPALRWLESGQAMCKFSVATTERFQDQAGLQRERTEWHQVVLWRELAEFADRHLLKGDTVYIEGRLRTRSWVDQEGREHRATEIVADRFDRISQKSSHSASPDAQEANERAQNSGPLPMDASSLPF